MTTTRLQKIHSPDAHVSDLAPLHVIRTETVLSRLPIHNLSKKGKVRIHISKKNEHGELDLYWKVSPNPDYGDPRQLAYKIDTIVINQKIDELGKPLPKVIRLESLRQICSTLDLSSGQMKVDIKKAFLQNAATFINAKLHYKAADGTERRLEAGFTRYSVVFTGERLPNGKKADAVYLILNDPYWEVLNNAPTRPLDYDYLKELTPAAQRFYEIVSYKIFTAIKFKHAHAKLSYSEYCTFSAQQRYGDFNRVKKQMYKVHRPHIQSGYIKSVHYTKSVDDDGNLDWIMEYEPGEKAHVGYDLFSKKRKQKTAEPLAQKESSETQAVEIVGGFYQRFHSRDASSPSSKELEQAKAIVEKYGIEKARFIIAYSYEKAQETKYKPQLFGGILQYVDPAVQSFTAREQKREQQKLESQEHDLQARYEQYREQEIEKVKAMLDGETLQSMEASIREDLTREGTFPAMIGMGVSMRIEAYLEERAGILPYEEWRTQQR
jgi:hypothetical protein